MRRGGFLKKQLHVLSWATMFLAFILVVFHRFAPAGLLPVFSSELRLSAAEFALLSSSYFYLYSLLQIPVGFLLDCFGPRRIGLLSLLILTLGSALFSTAAQLPQLILGRVILSIGAACIWGILMKIQHLHFPDRYFGVLTGFGAVAGSLGVMLTGPPFTHLISALGWRQALWVVTLIPVILFLLSMLSLKDLSVIAHVQCQTSMKKTLAMTGQVLKNKDSWFCFLSHFGIYGSYASLVGIWLIPYLVGVGSMNPPKAYGMITLMGLGFLIGGPALGMASDALGGQRRNILLLASGALTLIYLSIYFSAAFGYGERVYQVLFFFIGFFSSTVVMTMVLSRDLNPPESSGVAIGFANSGGFVGAAFSQLIVGALLERGWQGQYTGSLMVYSEEVFLGVIFVTAFFMIVSFAALCAVGKGNKR